VKLIVDTMIKSCPLRYIQQPATPLTEQKNGLLLTDKRPLENE